jgi:DNA-binding transcriptional LysR family regulator
LTTVELRQLEAFVAVATELHFGRAAARLQLGQPTLSELVKRLERELGTPLLTRTTRRVGLTAAGVELLAHSKTILSDIGEARAAVRRIAEGEAGTVRIGVTPPAAPVLAPYLCQAMAEEAPFVDVSVQRMWLPTLLGAIASGAVDVGLTCGLVRETPGISAVTFCAEPLLVGLRSEHPLANCEGVDVRKLEGAVLGTPAADLFPAWALAVDQALADLHLVPPRRELADNDLAATRWHQQPEIDWVLLIASLASDHHASVVRAAVPAYNVPFTLHWKPEGTNAGAVGRFVRLVLEREPPPGWLMETGHRHHASRSRAVVT